MSDGDMYRRLFASLTDCAVMLLDTDGRFTAWNHGAELIKGYTADEIAGEHFSILYPPEAVVAGHPDNELALARASGRYEEEGWRVRKDGTRFWGHVVIVAMYSSDGSLEGYGKFTRDLTERMQSEQQAANTLALLRATAETDSLTGASTRRALDAALGECIRAARPFCVALFDLDHFKQVNDEFGHAAGDNLLRRVSGVWRGGLRAGDLLARYGGEEFVLLLADCQLSQGVTIAERLRRSTPAPCKCSAGVAVWSPGMTPDDLMAGADKALYEAKVAGRDRVTPQPVEHVGPEVVAALRGLAGSGAR